MRRRDFIALLGAAGSPSLLWPQPMHAQQAPAPQPAKVWRIGIITGGIRTPAYDGFLQGLHEHGYVAGKDYVADWRIGDGRYSRFPNFAQEFVRLKADVIFVGTSAAVNPVREVARTIPIVMGYSIDPVGNGFVTSLMRPGGIVTGMAGSTEDTSLKQLEFLKAVAPTLSRVGLLLNPESGDYSEVLSKAQAAAQKAGVTLVWADARNAQGIDSAFTRFTGQGVEAVIVTDDGYFFVQQQKLAEQTLRHRLPSIYAQREFVQVGGLMSYGENIREFYHRAASFVDRIFKGARAGDLPIEQPKLNLAISRRAANALGITVPASLYAVADEVFD